jgi:hypothetical protein
MRFRARLAADKLTLLSRCGTASRTTDSERVSWAGVVLLHGGKWKRSTRVVSSSVRQRTPFGGLARSRFLAEFVPTFLRRFTLGQSLKTRLKMRTPFIQSFASHASASSRVLKTGNSRREKLLRFSKNPSGKLSVPTNAEWSNLWMVVALSNRRHPRLRSQGAPQEQRASRWSHRPVLAALPIFWAASSSPRPDEFRADAGLLTRHVWTSSHSVSIRPALFEGFLRWLVY